MSNKKTIIFDFDGTLANSVDLMLALYNENAKLFGYQSLAVEEFPDLRRMGYRRAMKKKGIKYWMVPKMVVKLGREMRNRMVEVKPYDGIITMLESLKNEGYSIGVLTSNQAPLVKEFFENHGFPAFDFVVAEKTLFGKDKALKRIMSRYELTSDQIVYVGDEPRDVAASKKAGISVVAVSWGVGGVEGFEKTTPTFLVHNPDELLQTLMNM